MRAEVVLLSVNSAPRDEQILDDVALVIRKYVLCICMQILLKIRSSAFFKTYQKHTKQSSASYTDISLFAAPCCENKLGHNKAAALHLDRSAQSA